MSPIFSIGMKKKTSRNDVDADDDVDVEDDSCFGIRCKFVRLSGVVAAVAVFVATDGAALVGS